MAVAPPPAGDQRALFATAAQNGAALAGQMTGGASQGGLPGYSLHDNRPGGAPVAGAPSPIGGALDGGGAPAVPVRTGLAGMGQRFGDWLHAPGTAAMLLRSGAVTMQDGLGAGIMAGAGYADQQKSMAAQAAQREFENQMAVLRQQVDQQQADQTGDYQRGQLTNDALRVEETGRANRAREGIDANGQRIQLYGIDTSATTQRRGQDVDRANTLDGLKQRERESQRDDSTRRYGIDTGAYTAGQELAAGIGSKAMVKTTTETPAKPGSNGWFGWGATPATPKTTTETMGPPASAQPTGGLRVGMVVDGKTYLGGNPNDKASWR